MKEININIEGYNVNGICVGCLNYDRKMNYDNDIVYCLKLLGNIDVPDGLFVQMCWECMAYIKKMKQFQEQILKSYDVLISYSREHTFLDSPSDFTQHAVKRLTTVIDTYDEGYIAHEDDFQEDIIKDEQKDNVKLELDNDIEYMLKEESSQPENQHYAQTQEFSETEDFTDTKDFNDSQDYPDNLESPDPVDEESDDDIQLSKLKKKKDKKKKSKKDKSRREKSTTQDTLEQRKSRKLKNLPADVVELVTLSDEDMWRIRDEDRDNKEFAKLKYKCDNCILGFNTEKLMLDHMTGKHSQKTESSIKCDVCKAYLLVKEHFVSHRSLHQIAFKCKECGLTTTLKNKMVSHVAIHVPEGKTFNCSNCKARFSTKSKLAYHKGVCHQEKPQCDCCGKVFASKSTLKYHLKLLLPQNKEEKPKEKLYIPCKGCTKVFHSKKSYRAHVVIHDGLLYPCQICGKLFQWKRNLARHMRNHRDRDNGAVHECRQCGKKFSSKDCLNNHMRLSRKHVNENNYIHECNYCGKKFATKWCMVDHIDWEHLKRIKYQCSVCFKPFKTAKIMVAHVNNIHGGKKPEPNEEHLCEICGKSYKTVKRLKGHVWSMHTNRSNTKSYRCKLCPATFTWQTSIYKHVKMMHDNNKRNKQPRLLRKANETFQNERVEQSNRLQYFQPNIPPNNLLQPPPVTMNLVANL